MKILPGVLFRKKKEMTFDFLPFFV